MGAQKTDSTGVNDGGAAYVWRSACLAAGPLEVAQGWTAHARMVGPAYEKFGNDMWPAGDLTGDGEVGDIGAP